jgi:hypothetical protein
MLASGFKVESDITPYALIANRHRDRTGPAHGIESGGGSVS